MDIQKLFGFTVKQIRNEIGISQEKFSLQIGMDRTYFASVEAGKRNLSLNNIQKIANGLNISISELFSQIEASPYSIIEKGDSNDT